METMLVSKLVKLRGHAEYGGKIVGELTQADLVWDGEWEFGTLAESIKDNGIMRPLDIHRFESGELNLMNGHHRAVIAIQLGLLSVPVIIRGL